MKLTNGFWQTYKEVPSEAEIVSHQLMLLAGLIQKVAAGIYNYLPVCLRSLRKVEKIIREELDKVGCFELSMGLFTPAELWKETKRWEQFGPLLLKIKDRAQRELCFSPTNEAAVTDVFRRTIKSYKNLPITLYQINPKFRDEIRPRYGVMRGREFIMMDAYSFHLDKNCLDLTYKKIYKAYEEIFNRMGLKYISVQADAGAMASSDMETHEFQVLAESGEDFIIYCHDCKYAANIEKARSKKHHVGKTIAENSENLTMVETKDIKTIEEVTNFFNVFPGQILKTLCYFYSSKTESGLALAILHGDDNLNEVKLKAALHADELRPAFANEILKIRLTPGFIGPILFITDEKIKQIFDESIDLSSAYIIGANEIERHYINFIPIKESKNDFLTLDIRHSKHGE